MRRICIAGTGRLSVGIATAFLCSSAMALFGPKTYDDCILDSMKGVTSDMAAAAIMKSCREKFPEQQRTYPDIPADDRQRIAVSPYNPSDIGRGSFLGTGSEAASKVSVYNGSTKWILKELLYAVESINGSLVPEAIKNRVLSQTVNIGPQRSDDFVVYARELGIVVDQKTRITMRVVGAKGVPVGR